MRSPSELMTIFDLYKTFTRFVSISMFREYTVFHLHYHFFFKILREKFGSQPKPEFFCSCLAGLQTGATNAASGSAYAEFGATKVIVSV